MTSVKTLYKRDYKELPTVTPILWKSISWPVDLDARRSWIYVYIFMNICAVFSRCINAQHPTRIFELEKLIVESCVSLHRPLFTVIQIINSYQSTPVHRKDSRAYKRYRYIVRRHERQTERISTQLVQWYSWKGMNLCFVTYILGFIEYNTARCEKSERLSAQWWSCKIAGRRRNYFAQLLLCIQWFSLS